MWTLLATYSAFASCETIDVKAKELTISIEKHLRLAKATDPNDSEAIRAVIEEVILPNVDSKYFSYKILGKHVTKMTKEQKLMFTQLIKKSMVNNYVSILRLYNNETLLLESVSKSKSGKTAKSRIKISSNLGSNSKDKRIVLTWRFHEEKNTWEIYDLEAEGISLLKSKQKEIASIIKKQGIENMLTLLSDKD